MRYLLALGILVLTIGGFRSGYAQELEPTDLPLWQAFVFLDVLAGDSQHSHRRDLDLMEALEAFVGGPVFVAFNRPFFGCETARLFTEMQGALRANAHHSLRSAVAAGRCHQFEPGDRGRIISVSARDDDYRVRVRLNPATIHWTTPMVVSWDLR